MNAAAEKVMDAPVARALVAVQDARALAESAETAHRSDSEALARGRDRLSTAAAVVQRIDAENEAAIARHAARLEKQAREGSAAALPQLMPSDQHFTKELIAHRTHAAAVTMMASLQSATDASAAKVAAARRVVDTALHTLRTAEIHERIHSGLILLDQFEATYAEIFVRTESRGDSKFGNEIDDPEPSHMRLRSVWDCLQRQRMGPTSQRGVLEPQPPLQAARAALAARDAQLLNPTTEQPS